MTVKLTRGQAIAADVSALLRARHPLLWVVTREEARAESLLFESGRLAGYVARTWDVAKGARDFTGQQVGSPDLVDPRLMMEFIENRAQSGNTRDLWIMRDLPAWLGQQFARECRTLRNLVRVLPSVPTPRSQAIVVLTTSAEVPPELAGHCTVIEWPLPDRQEIAEILDVTVSGLPEERRAAAAPNGTREAAIDAAIGLTEEEAKACYAKSIVQTKGRIDPATVAQEKKRVIARERVLEWYDPLPGGLDAVGGLEVLKGWLLKRKLAFGPKARAFNLPAPKGVLLVGVSGTGKSLTAKAIATAFDCPLLRFDLGAMLSKYVGDSQQQIRKAFRVIEAIGRCVVWFDEIEKALAGATQGAADGGVSADQLGAMLQWMQERAGEAFIVATSNDVSALPPELLRKGRFDEIFFVDLPNESERCAIAAAALRANGRGDVAIDLQSVAAKTEGFTGAEIAALVPEALFEAFDDGMRQITTTDLLNAARNVVPLKQTAGDKITKLQEWAKGRARPASAPSGGSPLAQNSARVLEI